MLTIVRKILLAVNYEFLVNLSPSISDYAKKAEKKWSNFIEGDPRHHR